MPGLYQKISIVHNSDTLFPMI